MMVLSRHEIITSIRPVSRSMYASSAAGVSFSSHGVFVRIPHGTISAPMVFFSVQVTFRFHFQEIYSVLLLSK